MGSPLIARIKADALRILAAVPSGRVAGLAELGAHLGVPPGQLGHLLATLPEAEKAKAPWHRAVAESGLAGAPQRALLEAEGARFDAEGCLLDLDARRIALAELAHGVPPRMRAAATPTARRLRFSDTSAARGPAGRNR